MRSFLISSLTFFWALGSGVAFAQPRLVDVDAERLFIPTGYDDNDQVEVVVDGMLPSSCYEVTSGEWELDPTTGHVTIYPQAVYRDGPCLQVLVPYTKVYNLGILPMGGYDVEARGVAVKPLRVSEASNSGPDDVMYASIDNAYVQYIETLDQTRVVLEGNYTNTCMVWEKTDVVINDPSVIEVLPTVRIQDRTDCEDRVIPFKGVSVTIPNLEQKGRYLLHVRSMNGNAINRVFSHEP